MTRVVITPDGFCVYRDDMKFPWIPYFIPMTYPLEHLVKIIREGWR